MQMYPLYYCIKSEYGYLSIFIFKRIRIQDISDMHLPVSILTSAHVITYAPIIVAKIYSLCSKLQVVFAFEIHSFCYLFGYTPISRYIIKNYASRIAKMIYVLKWREYQSKTNLGLREQVLVSCSFYFDSLFYNIGVRGQSSAYCIQGAWVILSPN